MRALIITAVLLLAVQFSANATCNPRNCPKGDKGDTGEQGIQGVAGDDANRQFDYGAYLNLIVFETPNSEWGVLGTYTMLNSEARAYVGGKLYLNRMIKSK
jgi:hypothetical protein